MDFPRARAEPGHEYELSDCFKGRNMPSQIEHPENGHDDGDEMLPTFDIDFQAPSPGAPSTVPVPAALPYVAATTPVAASCPICGGVRKPTDSFCADCGYFYREPYPTDAAGAAEAIPVAMPIAAPAHNSASPLLVRKRYELLRVIGERRGVTRYEARDLGLSGGENTPIIVVRQELPEPSPAASAPAATDEEDILPTFDEPSAAITQSVTMPTWPSVAWERSILDSLQHSALPVVMDSFTEDGFEYLVLEVPDGRSLWDAWDEATNKERFTWL